MRFRQHFKQLMEGRADAAFNYEKVIVGKLQQSGVMPKDQAAAGASARANDGTIGKHGLEIKANPKAGMGQMAIHHNGKKWVISPKSAEMYPKTAAYLEKNYMPHLNKQWGKPTGSYEGDLERLGNHYHKVEGTEPITTHYTERGARYIHIGGGSGLYHTGRDVAGLRVPKLKGNTQIRARVKRHNSSKEKKAVYSHTITMSLLDHEPSSSVDFEKATDRKQVATQLRK